MHNSSSAGPARARRFGRSTRTTSKIIATAIMALTVASVQAPVAAETRAFNDAVGDVRHGMDIHKVRIVNEQRLVVKTWHRRVQPGEIAIYIDTRPATGPEFGFVAGVGFDTDWQVVRMQNWQFVGNRRNCPSDYGFSRRTDTVRASISRACLDGADRVRVSVKANAEEGRPDWAPGFRRFFPWMNR